MICMETSCIYCEYMEKQDYKCRFYTRLHRENDMKEIDFDSSSCSDKGIAFMLGGGVEGG